MRPTDPFEAAIASGAISALRKRSAIRHAIADEATTALDQTNVTVMSPEARLSRRMARDWDAIADEIEGGDQ